MTKDSGSLFEDFSRPVFEAIEENGLEGEQISRFLDELLKDAPQSLFKDLKDSAPEMLQEEEEIRIGFEERNFERWKVPLKLLLMLFRMTSEIGEAHSHEGPVGGNLVVFDTLARLHPRGLLTTSEIVCLLRGGFADAALSRWRTLHELSIVAMFIEKHGSDVALTYRSSSIFAEERAAKQYNKYSKKAGWEPVKASELAELERRSAGAEELIGRKLKGDWDWASEVLGKERPTFFDLEQNVEMDHWRPRVKWASQATHAGFIEPMSTLGMSEAEEPFFQIGPSNSGLADPIRMTAISLTHLTTTFLLCLEPNVDRIIMVKLLQVVADEISKAAIKASSLTIEDLGHLY